MDSHKAISAQSGIFNFRIIFVVLLVTSCLSAAQLHGICRQPRWQTDGLQYSVYQSESSAMKVYLMRMNPGLLDTSRLVRSYQEPQLFPGDDQILIHRELKGGQYQLAICTFPGGELIWDAQVELDTQFKISQRGDLFFYYSPQLYDSLYIVSHKGKRLHSFAQNRFRYDGTNCTNPFWVNSTEFNEFRNTSLSLPQITTLELRSVNMKQGYAELWMSSNRYLAGFQFRVKGVPLSGAMSGISEEYKDWQVSWSPSGMVVGIVFGRDYLAPGEYMLTRLEFAPQPADAKIEIQEAILAGPVGEGELPVRIIGSEMIQEKSPESVIDSSLRRITAANGELLGFHSGLRRLVYDMENDTLIPYNLPSISTAWAREDFSAVEAQTIATTWIFGEPLSGSEIKRTFWDDENAGDSVAAISLLNETSTIAEFVTFSPDSSQFAYVKSDSLYVVSRRLGGVIPIDSISETAVLGIQLESTRPYDWGPESNIIFYASHDRIWLYRLADGLRLPLTIGPYWGS